ERDVAKEVTRGHDLEQWQRRDRGEGMRRERKRRRARPRALERGALERIFGGVGAARAAVDLPHDLEQKARRSERSAHRAAIGGASEARNASRPAALCSGSMVAAATRTGP